jgi:hypothetical protein
MTARSRLLAAGLLGCLVANAAAVADAASVADGAAHDRSIEPGETVRLVLNDRTSVTVIREEVEDGSAAHAYRYLPANLTLARRRDGAAEFSFLPYRRDEGGEIEGGIMHLLLHWGLSEAQVADLQRVLRREVDSLGTVMGAVPVRPWGGERSWEITSRSAVGSTLNRSLSSAGDVPTEPGSKVAMSFRFDGADAARMDEALRSGRRSWKDRVRFRFAVGGAHGGSRRGGVRGTGEPDWVLERDLATLLPRTGE